MLSHVIALSGVLLLRRDRPNWPRPIKLGKVWMWLAGLFCALNSIFIIFGVYGLKYTGYGFDYLERGVRRSRGHGPSPTARVPAIIIVGVLVLVAGVVGYIIAQQPVGQAGALEGSERRAADAGGDRRRSRRRRPRPLAETPIDLERAGQPALSASGD